MTFTTMNDARAYAESILHDDARPDEIEYVAGEAWELGSTDAFKAEYPDDGPAWMALLDAAAYSADLD